MEHNFCRIIALSAYVLSSSAAKCDDFGMSIQEFPNRMMQQFGKLGDKKTKVTLDHCLKGSGKERNVCTYTVGSDVVAMAAGAPGEEQLSDLTFICRATTDLGGLKCINTYAVAIAMILPDLEPSGRGKIIKVLFNGLDAGDVTQIVKDNNRFILQRVAGSLWFNVEAGSAP